MTRAAVALIGILVTGCATFRSLPPEARTEELTWQSLHLIDTAQTLSATHDPDCYFETVSDPVIGRHPSGGVVILWMATAASLHFLITDWLVEHQHPALARTWEAITIGSTAYWVSHNFSVGNRLFGHNEPPNGVCDEPK